MHKPPGSISIAALLLLILSLTGCGGAGSDGGTARAIARIAVDWPARSRAVTALSSALSVSIVLRGANGEADATLGQDRAAGAAAYSATYATSNGVSVGEHPLELSFFSGPGGAGDKVGSVALTVRVEGDGSLVRPNGDPLGSIQVASNITKVALGGGQSVEATADKQLMFTAQNAADQVVAVSEGSAFFSTVSGGAILTLSPSGLAHGIALGEATVKVSVDGVESPAAAVNVVAPTPVVTSFAAEANSIVGDPTRGLIYAASPQEDLTHPNSLVAYDPATGEVVRAVALPVEPHVIALSGDAQYAYVSQNGAGKVIRVNLNSFAPDMAFPLAVGRSDTVFRMEVRPSHPTQVAVTHLVNGGSESELTIYDNGVAMPKGDTSVHQVAFSGPDKLYGGHFGAMTAYTVDGTGVTATLHNNNAPGYSYAYLSHAGGRLYENQFGVLDGTTMNILGTFPGRQNSSLIVPDQTRPYAFGLTWGLPPSRTLKIFRKGDFSLHSELTIPEAGNSTNSFVQVSQTSFAFTTAGPNKIFVIKNVYVP